MGADRRDRPLEQLVAGAVTLAVVERLEPDDVDVGDDEQAVAATAALELVIELDETGRSSPRAGELVVGGAVQRIGEQLAIDERVQALAGGLFAILGRALAVLGGARVLLDGLLAPAGAGHAGARRRCRG